MEDDGVNNSSFTRVLGAAGEQNIKYEKVRLLGSGSFGEAWLVKRVSDGARLVAKWMVLNAMSNEDHKYVEAEMQCLATSNHFAIAKYVEDFFEDAHMLIITEFAVAGDLNTQIEARAAEGLRYFEEYEIGRTFVQVAMALDHMHRRKMLHRDIKAANVLLMANGLVKLGDFGFCQLHEVTVSSQVASTVCGTPDYLAPELWKRQRYSKKADVWALGVLLYEMMALQRPFAGQDMPAVMDRVLNGKYAPLPSKFSADLQEVVSAALVPDPNNRPSILQLFQMPQLQRLLNDFEASVAASTLVTDELKLQINQNIQQFRETSATKATSDEDGR